MSIESPDKEHIPRRRHTKSRNGCQTCKRRHVRCDELLPQCRNCTRLGIACEYVQSPDSISQAQDGESSQPLQKTGNHQFHHEFPSLQRDLYPFDFPPHDHQLFHHLISVTARLGQNGACNLSTWTAKLTIFIDLSKSHDCLRYALLALSAHHLGMVTKSAELDNIASAHQISAYNCLQEAINNFSSQNSDAAFAASIVLSWQVAEWRGWSSLIEGNRAIVKSMQPWIEESIFGRAMTYYSTDYDAAASSPLCPTRHGRAISRFDLMCSALFHAESFMSATKELSAVHQKLTEFTSNLRTFPPDHNNAQEQVKIFYPIRCWLYYMPSLYTEIGNKSVDIMVAFALYNATVWAVSPFFPAVDRAVFRKMDNDDVVAAKIYLVDLRENPDWKERLDRLEEAIAIIAMVEQIFG